MSYLQNADCTLLLKDPIALPGPAGPSHPQEASTAIWQDPRIVSETLPLQLERPPTSIWPVPEAEASASTDDLWMVYNDALWLGELHTSLGDFVGYVERIEAIHQQDISQLVVRLATMLRARSTVQRRFASTAASALETTCVGPNDTLEAGVETLYPDHNEARSIKSALMGGPAAAVTAALRRQSEARLMRPGSDVAEVSEAGGQTGMSDNPDNSGFKAILSRWLRAIESRDSCIEPSRRRLIKMRTFRDESAVPEAGSSDPNTPQGTRSDKELRPKKRSRKLDKPKRWDASRDEDLHDDYFLWQKKSGDKRNRRGDPAQAETVDVLNVVGAAVVDPEHLNRRLEALIDVLCLDQITASLHSDLGSFLGDLEDAVAGVSTQPTSNRFDQAFGTSARQRDPNDELDDVQWLCRRIVEPAPC
ncbi:uncharacterized protein PFL1_05712 [Pseudozyma flocculosa PF-1]|uniref:Uncharacterized protein n=1 Tax=Pseudozyma flocculosa PF-1 TaxID=1277687 RepID=A0A061H2N5_9BASI|nr:uncharacterized protein PFL1_05712 [Pseudozyma flocculosa PF-1]EPQ26733.1 hypothetical protein PFL1_05712 [Pseudozyma flocculosa PF-1]